MALPRPSLDGVVPPVRDLALPARADAVRRLPGAQRSVALRPLPAARPRGRVARRSGRRRRGRCRRTSPRRSSPTRSTGCARAASGSPWPATRRSGSCGGCRARSSSGSAIGGPFDELGPGGEVEHRVIPWDEVSLEEGTGIVHIAPGAGQEDFELGRVHDLPVLSPVDEAGRFYDAYGWLHGLSTTEAADQIVGRLAEQGYLLEAGHVRPPLPALLALRHAAHLACHRRLADLGRGAPPAAARRERDRRVDARLHGQAHGRLAAEHGRLEHLAAPLLRTAVAHLPVRVRARHRDRLAGRARGACRLRARAARGAPAAVDRRRADPLRGVRRAGRAGRRGRRRLARRGNRPVLDARLGEPRVRRAGVRDRAPRAGSRGPTSPTTRTGRSGSPPTGSRRCASRSGSGSTRSSSCPSCSRGGRRSGRCSATRRCSTRPAARCTARGGTRSTRRMRSRAWAPT